MDPEILYADNLVENKHKLLTRSRRRGPHDQDLKPNPATRDILAALTTRPSSDPLTSVEKDLIWRFRFYLSNNKKALTKFLYCVTCTYNVLPAPWVSRTLPELTCVKDTAEHTLLDSGG